MSDSDEEEVLLLLTLLLLQKRRKKRSSERNRKFEELRRATINASNDIIRRNEHALRKTQFKESKNHSLNNSKKLSSSSINRPIYGKDQVSNNSVIDVTKVKKEINPYQDDYASEEDDINAGSPAVEVKIEPMDDWNTSF